MDAILCIMLVMRSYPKELRSRVVAAGEQGELTIADVAQVFSVGLTFVKKMLRLHRAGEDLAPRHGGGPTPLLQEPERALLRAAVAKQPDVTLAEVQALLVARGSRAVLLVRPSKRGNFIDSAVGARTTIVLPPKISRSKG